MNSSDISRKRTEIISPDAREKERPIVALAMSGRHTLAEMARVSGRSRSTIQVSLESFREVGVEALLERSTAPGSTPSLDFEVHAWMVEKINEGAWHTARSCGCDLTSPIIKNRAWRDAITGWESCWGV